MPKPGSESVLGFAFARTGGWGTPRWVALIKKSRPPWAAGKYNGVGGAVEPPEEPAAAMVREFLEESGVPTRPEDWRLVAVLGRAAAGVMYVYAAVVEGLVPLTEDGPEPCGWFPTDELPADVVPNLRWLVPLCLDDRLADVVHVPYRGRASDPKETADG